MEDKNDLPLTVLREFRELKFKCHDLQIFHSRILSVSFEEFGIFLFAHKTGSKFYYRVTNPGLDLNNRKPKVTIEYKPRTADMPEAFSAQAEIGSIENSINRWLNLVLEYDQLSLDVNDRYFENKQDEIFASFEIVDDNANSAPFDENHQRLLVSAVEAFEHGISSANFPEIDSTDILKESDELKTKVQTLSKNQAARAFARIKAKIIYKGRPFAETVFKDARQAFLKIMIEKGIELVTEHFPKLIGHLF